MKRTSFSAVIFATLTMLVGLLAGLDRTFAADDAKAFRMIVGEPRFMDPNLATDYSIYVNVQLFEPLARIDNTGKLTLLQAKSIEVGADGRTWTITLNPDYKWSNGQPITAADWEYSWKRILDPKLSSEVATFLSDVENADDYNKGKITDVDQVAIKATGEHTLASRDRQGRAEVPSHTCAALPDADPKGGGRESRGEVDRAREYVDQRSLQTGQPQERSVDRYGSQSLLRRQEAGDPAHRDDDRVWRSLHRAAARL